MAECMEALGGVGYLENEDPELNVARLFRDANVLSIWEGTTNVMADDLVRVVKGKEGEKALGSVRRLVDGVVSTKGLAGSSTAEAISTRTEQLQDWISKLSADELRAEGRVLLSKLGWVICAALLGLDATQDGDEVAREVLERWVRRTEGWPGSGFQESNSEKSPLSSDTLRMDRLIVFGEEKIRERGKI